MRVIGFNCSPRKDGNTSIAIKTVLKALEKEDIETESMHIAEKLVYGCRACGTCKKTGEGFCVIDSYIINE